MCRLRWCFWVYEPRLCDAVFFSSLTRPPKIDPQLAEAQMLPGYRAKPERTFLLHLEAFDWNCPQHITPRFTERQIEAALAPVGARIAQLEAENKMLRGKFAIIK